MKTPQSHPVDRLLRRLLHSRPPRATSLAVSVFGDAAVPHGGVLWLGTLIGWLAPFGVNERAVRTAIHRLAADDWFGRRSVGRRTDVRLTEVSRHRFADAERRIYALAPPAWDGTWTIVVLHSGAISLARREEARRELRLHGFGELGPQVLLHPSADVRELELALADLRIARHAIVLRAGPETRLPGEHAPLRELVASAWGLRQLAEEYRAYQRRFEPLLEALRNDPPASETCFRIRVLAIHEYRRILLRDPELPAELLPNAWVGAQARGLCAAIYRTVERSAEEHVLDVGATATGRLPAARPPYYRRFGGLREAASDEGASATAVAR
jgi:phenylacetic acid degradation operon negative regulatory protein